LSTHPTGNPSFAQQPFVFATTPNPGVGQQYFHGHPQPNFAYPFFLTPPLASTPSTPESPLFTYSTPSSSMTGGTTYSA
jgi:hypothetical protein